MTPLSIILFTIFAAIQSLIIFGQMFKCMGGDGPCPEVEDMAAQRKEARNDIVKQIGAMVGGAVAAGPSVAAQSLSIYAPFSAYYFTVPQVFILWFQVCAAAAAVTACAIAVCRARRAHRRCTLVPHA